MVGDLTAGMEERLAGENIQRRFRERSGNIQ
jgi:hypothetical protein